MTWPRATGLIYSTSGNPEISVTRSFVWFVACICGVCVSKIRRPRGSSAWRLQGDCCLDAKLSANCVTSDERMISGAAESEPSGPFPRRNADQTFRVQIVSCWAAGRRVCVYARSCRALQRPSRTSLLASQQARRGVVFFRWPLSRDFANPRHSQLFQICCGSQWPDELRDLFLILTLEVTLAQSAVNWISGSVNDGISIILHICRLLGWNESEFGVFSWQTSHDFIVWSQTFQVLVSERFWKTKDAVKFSLMMTENQAVSSTF